MKSKSSDNSLSAISEAREFIIYVVQVAEKK